MVEPGRGIRVVAEGFYFTNEIRLDAREQWLYIVETTGPCITRMRLDESDPQGVQLRDREVFGPAHLGGYPDGIAFDAHGNLWCTLVMVHQLIALTPQGDKLVLLDDGDPEAFEKKRQICTDFLQKFGYQIELLPDSYPHAGWMVENYLALPT